MLNYKNLNDVKLPSSIKSIGAHAFDENWENAHRDSNGYVVYNGILISADNAQGEVVIPENIKCIGNYEFSYNNITSVAIYSKVKKIGKYSFYRCKNLSLEDLKVLKHLIMVRI